MATKFEKGEWVLLQTEEGLVKCQVNFVIESIHLIDVIMPDGRFKLVASESLAKIDKSETSETI